MAIKALFLDFGNVFSTFVFADFYRNLRKEGHTELSEEALDLIAHRHYWSLDKGEITRTEYYTRFTQDMGATLSQEEFEQCFLEIFTDHVHKLEPVLARVEERVELFLLSNTNEIHYERYIREHPFLYTYIAPQNQVLSYRVGASKPEQKIFDHALGHAGCIPHEAFFIDDMEANIAAWKALGGHGIVWHGGEHPIETLEDALRAHGVLKTERA